MREMTVTVRVEGRVQGVWFRAWTKEEAEALGLSGWVRNEPDGSVAAVLSGPEARVREMLAALHRGPPEARVRDVTWEEAGERPREGFSILR